MPPGGQDHLTQDVAALIACVEGGADELTYAGLLKDICFVDPEELKISCDIAIKVLPAVLQKFNSTCERLVGKCGAHNASAGQEMMGLLEVAIASVESTKALFERVSCEEHETDRDMLMALCFGLDLIHSSYSHWKAKAAYGALLGEVETTLVRLSDVTVQLQMLLVQSLEKVELSAPYEEQPAMLVLANVCEKLRELATLLQGLDLKMLISIRKILAKTLLRYRDGLKRNVGIDAHVKDLCTYVTDWLLKLECVQPGCENNFLAEMKAAAFHLRLLDSLLTKYEGFYSCSMESAVKMTVFLSRLPASEAYYPNLTAARRSDLLSYVWIATEHFVARLTCNREFCAAALRFDVIANSECGYLLMLATMLDHIVEVTDVWSQPPSEGNIFYRIFSCIDKCILELQCPVLLKQTSTDGKPPRDVGLYEHLCAHMCRFVPSLPEACFPALESLLLTNVLAESHWRASLASDVWCFVARFGSLELCYEHVQLLARVVKLTATRQGNGPVHARRLLTRMFRFLSDNHKKLLLDLHSNNPEVLCALPLLHPMPTTNANALRMLVTKLADKTITPLELRDLVHLLQRLKNSPTLQSAEVPDVILSRALMHIPLHRSPVCTALIEGLIILAASQIPLLRAPALCEILTSMDLCCISGITSLCIMTVLHLPRFGEVQNLSDAQEAVFCAMLSRLFASVLSSKNYVVQHMAIVAFAQFAQVTQYNTVITKATESPSVKQAVMSFLMQPQKELEEPFCWVSFIRKQEEALLVRPSKKAASRFAGESGTLLEDEMTKKRRKCKDETEQLVENVEDAVARLLQQPRSYLGPMRLRLVRVENQLSDVLASM